MDILYKLMQDGESEFRDFGKIVIMFCGLQSKIFQDSTLTKLFYKFL